MQNNKFKKDAPIIHTTNITKLLSKFCHKAKVHFYRGEVEIREGLASSYSFKGNYKAAWEQINYLKLFIKSEKDSTDFGSIYGSLGLLYGMQSKYNSSI